MATNDEQCVSIPNQSNVKSRSVSKCVLQIYQQNIQGIKWKSDEILDFFCPYFPHLVCITEHHLNRYEIVPFHIGKYTLGANYCRHLLTLWGPTSCYARQCVPLHEVQRRARLDTLRSGYTERGLPRRAGRRGKSRRSAELCSLSFSRSSCHLLCYV